MKISVIVPVYKVEPYLRRCVDSILAQTYRDFELILVDDGSPDRCGAICDEYAKQDARVVVIHQKNGGLSAARNAGIDWAFANSNSQWITFIDSDDIVLPSFLDCLMSGVALGVDVAGVRILLQRSANPVREQKFFPSALINPETFWINERSHNSACAKLYNKKLFSDVRFPCGKLHEDEYITYKILFKQESIAFSDSQLYAYCLRENSITTGMWNERHTDSFAAIVDQCFYFHKHKHYAAFNSALTDLENISSLTVTNWQKICVERRIAIRCEVNKLPMHWLPPICECPSLMTLRTPMRSFIVLRINHCVDFLKRRGIVGGIRYLHQKKCK